MARSKKQWMIGVLPVGLFLLERRISYVLEKTWYVDGGSVGGFSFCLNGEDN